MAETRYDISHSQVGVAGSNAHVHDIQFRQNVERLDQSVNLALLSNQLDQLKSELAKQASERDHYAALVAVSDAAVDAKAGDNFGALSKLSVAGIAAGKWAFDVATKIGVSVAAEAIKTPVGLK
jgi:hypothetical protein